MAQQPKGYVAAAIGCFVGGVGLFFAGFALGIWYVERFMPNAGLEGIVPPFFGGAGGAVLGMGIGTWLALRIRRYPGAGPTGALAAVFGPALALATAFVIEIVADELIDSAASEWLVPFVAGAAAAGAAVGSRALVVRFRASRSNDLRTSHQG